MKELDVYMADIIDSIAKIQDYTNHISEDEFYSNSMIQDAVLRRIEIIGEAVKNIPYEFKEKHHKIPWKDIAGMRDILIHQYSGVELRRVWLVIKDDLPELKIMIANL